MTVDRRCSSCGALVTADADWCGQCFASLAEPAAAPAPRSERRGEGPPPAGAPSAGIDAGDPRTAAPHWSCPACGEGNSLALDACAVCGTPFARLFDEPREAADVPRSRAVAWSLVYPGLGHRVVRRPGEGVARAAVFTLALGAIVFLAVARAGNELGPILGFLAVYAAFAVATYVFAAVEAGHLADGGDPLVSPRTFAWFAAGLVIVSLGVSVFIAVGATRGG